MKPKLLNFLTVCLLTLVVLSPAIGVVGLVWKHHLDFMTTQHLLYAVNDSQQLTTHEDNTVICLSLWLMFFSPIGFGLGIALYDRYVVYRTSVLQRQVEMLERLWERNTYPEEIIL
ncbi:hypothetical protein F7734_08990 [Scytonema sp. UIC 10036]|uniref:hypothetical protein n=1 Tax=Scytonema sp. UIC 10036 TaxID=2304196 RepID=UPI0012DA8180|nr:hypothetical protein [Scytonema sp. UIC 10036]MUG92586.1 hypothetical protein [Scytonema sp. UIC 10036]